MLIVVLKVKIMGIFMKVAPKITVSQKSRTTWTANKSQVVDALSEE